MAHEAIAREEHVKGSSNRTFGLFFALVFSIVAAWPLRRGFEPDLLRWWWLVPAAALLVAALAAPRLLAPLNRAWMAFGLLLARIMNPLILGVMFFVVVTPIGLLKRLFSGAETRRRADPAVASYWRRRPQPGPAPATMRQQF